MRKVLILFLAYPLTPASAELRPATNQSWMEYIRAANSRVRKESERRALWIDGEPGLRSRVRAGEIVASPTSGKSPVSIPNGLIHDWIGAVFIPNAALDDVVAVVQDYSRYAQYYGPTVRSSTTVFNDGEQASFRVRYVQQALFVTVVFDAQYEVKFCHIDDQRWYSVAHSTSIHQIRKDGPVERTLPADDKDGYVWRTYSNLKLEAADGGVYVEQQSIALSPKIPVMLRWMVEPYVERLSRSLVMGWLSKTRSAVLAAAH
ncbi:MAG: hypothetical protein JO307_04370 [Bryobacterales bacterium]|nr:hypothetical protein [Bryobacterales bacterium]MBV9397730.1 hypothetical protein [Bryobacterales bacterium]